MHGKVKTSVLQDYLKSFLLLGFCCRSWRSSHLDASNSVVNASTSPFSAATIRAVLPSLSLASILADFFVQQHLDYLVDLVRLLLPHLANPHDWCATFLAGAASQLDQGSRQTETPDPTDEPRTTAAGIAAFRVVYVKDEQGNFTPFVDHSGSKAALRATLAALSQPLREGALRAIGLPVAFKAGEHLRGDTRASSA